MEGRPYLGAAIGTTQYAAENYKEELDWTSLPMVSGVAEFLWCPPRQVFNGLLQPKHEIEKRSMSYKRITREVEHASFTPLVMSTMSVVGME